MTNITIDDISTPKTVVKEEVLDNLGFIKVQEFKDLSRLYMHQDSQAVLYVQYFGKDFIVSSYHEANNK